MVVGDKHVIDRRQLVEAQGRRDDPLGPGEAYRRSPLGKDRVGQQVQAQVLDQHGGMADPGDLQAGRVRVVDQSQVGCDLRHQPGFAPVIGVLCAAEIAHLQEIEKAAPAQVQVGIDEAAVNGVVGGPQLRGCRRRGVLAAARQARAEEEQEQGRQDQAGAAHGRSVNFPRFRPAAASTSDPGPGRCRAWRRSWSFPLQPQVGDHRQVVAGHFGDPQPAALAGQQTQAAKKDLVEAVGRRE